jgi:hypothetical protein
LIGHPSNRKHIDTYGHGIGFFSTPTHHCSCSCLHSIL